MDKIIKVQDLSFEYSTNKIFTNIGFEIDDGSYTSFVGNNKSGKTTLLKLIAGILPSNKKIIAGYSYVNSKRIYDTVRFFGVCLSAFEHQYLFKDVYHELSFPLENLNYKTATIEEKIIQLATEFEKKEMLDKKIEDLTLSEKQLLSLMIACIHEPKVLLLDQPFNMMKANEKRIALRFLKKLNSEKNTTIILFTTNLEDALSTDYTYVLHNGNIVMEGNPISVFQEEKIVTQVGLELPFMIDLSLKLKFYELLDKPIVNMEEMVDTLWK